MLTPLKAVLPFRHSDEELPAADGGIGGIDLGGLERRMRARWRTVSELWERNKSAATRLNLLGQLDYMRKLSSQLEWRQESGDRPVRVVYASAGRPTASVLANDDAIVDYKLFWVQCKDEQEARYLLAIVNSEHLYESVKGLMSKGQFGARDLQKHLWKLAIPEFDDGNPLHVRISEAGRVAEQGAARRLEQLRQERDRVTVTIVRREIRKWLAAEEEGRAVEDAVSELLRR